MPKERGFELLPIINKLKQKPHGGEDLLALNPKKFSPWDARRFRVSFRIITDKIWQSVLEGLKKAVDRGKCPQRVHMGDCNCGQKGNIFLFRKKPTQKTNYPSTLAS